MRPGYAHSLLKLLLMGCLLLQLVAPAFACEYHNMSAQNQSSQQTADNQSTGQSTGDVDKN